MYTTELEYPLEGTVTLLEVSPTLFSVQTPPLSEDAVKTPPRQSESLHYALSHYAMSYARVKPSMR